MVRFIGPFDDPRVKAILERHNTNLNGFRLGIDCYDMLDRDMQRSVREVVKEIRDSGIGTTEIEKWLSFVDSF